VRAPAADQSWRYAKHDLFTGALIQTQTDRISAVTSRIDIISQIDGGRETVDPPAPSGAAGWWRTHMSRPAPSGDLPGEVQEPWGMVLVDPHWSEVQVYENPIPLWPVNLEPGWRGHVKTRYKSAETGPGLDWDQVMRADDWETVQVPAGRFRTLRFTNSINFVSSDFSRANCMRRETVWFAPEIGRWAARESRGSYSMDESVSDDPYNESSYRWELMQWT
jgi:hypothetical protein